jgi:hypothetical protein
MTAIHHGDTETQRKSILVRLDSEFFHVSPCLYGERHE